MTLANILVHTAPIPLKRPQLPVDNAKVCHVAHGPSFTSVGNGSFSIPAFMGHHAVLLQDLQVNVEVDITKVKLFVRFFLPFLHTMPFVPNFR